MVKDHWNKVCAFCERTLDKKSREHIFPKSIGGTTVVSDFICGPCNNRKGAKWDSVLEEELRPWIICFGLSDKVIAGETEHGEHIYYHPESHSFRYDKDSTFDKYDVGGHFNSKEMRNEVIKNADNKEKKEMNVSGTIYREGDLNGVLKNIKSINKHSDQDLRIDTEISWIQTEEKQIKIDVPAQLTNPQSIRSAIKTCLATLYYASYSREDIRGIGIDQCDMIKKFLLEEGSIDQLDITKTLQLKGDPKITLEDLLTNPPIHRVTWIGDNNNGKLLAKICYFDRIAMEIKFSATYSGPTFDFSHTKFDLIKFVENMSNRYGGKAISEALGFNYGNYIPKYPKS